MQICCLPPHVGLVGMSPHSTVSFLTGERHPGLADDDNADEDVDRSSDDDDNVMQMRFR